MKYPKEAREAIINAYYKYGNMAQVGRLFKLTRERIRQIVEDYKQNPSSYPHILDTKLDTETKEK